jgi:pimeloyl-ACP methyl ester carboxylesterase
MKAVEATVERIPHGKFVTISDASHFSNLDNPAEFNRHILEFLKEVDGQ